jgi:hypothetical protein
MQRRRFKNILSFPDRLDQEIERLKAEAQKLPPGNHKREMLLRKVRQAETALRINDWLSSPGLQPPKAVENFAARRSREDEAQ